jgi:hypothetical protein
MPDDDFKSARGSTFDDATTASGLPRSTPGIALRDSSTVGHWYEVIGSGSLLDEVSPWPFVVLSGSQP